MSNELRDVRVCVFGGSFVAGVGDPKSLGWVGRLAARTPESTGIALTMYNLGVRGETTEEMVVRMPMECAPRFARGDEHRVVIATGLNDAGFGIDPARSAATLDFGLASLSMPALVVGPPPVGDDELQERLQVLDEVYAHICARRSVKFISTFAPLAGRKAWATARAADGMHPDQTGYGLLAYVVLHGGWYDWLGVQPPASPVKRRTPELPVT